MPKNIGEVNFSADSNISAKRRKSWEYLLRNCLAPAFAISIPENLVGINMHLTHVPSDTGRFMLNLTIKQYNASWKKSFEADFTLCEPIGGMSFSKPQICIANINNVSDEPLDAELLFPMLAEYIRIASTNFKEELEG